MSARLHQSSIDGTDPRLRWRRWALRHGAVARGVDLIIRSTARLIRLAVPDRHADRRWAWLHVFGRQTQNAARSIHLSTRRILDAAAAGRGQAI